MTPELTSGTALSWNTLRKVVIFFEVCLCSKKFKLLLNWCFVLKISWWKPEQRCVLCFWTLLIFHRSVNANKADQPFISTCTLLCFSEVFQCYELFSSCAVKLCRSACKWLKSWISHFWNVRLPQKFLKAGDTRFRTFQRISNQRYLAKLATCFWKTEMNVRVEKFLPK